MPYAVASRRVPADKLYRQYPDSVLADVTSRGPEPWVAFSPFFPHGGIPVPFSPGHYSMTVEGIWQGLKVFERADVDTSKMTITSMRNIKRSSRTYGKVLGHREGLQRERLLSYSEARHAIYLPSYRWMLENRLQDELDLLTQLGKAQMVVLLDYETNCDIADLSRPLSHACLISSYLQGSWPDS